MEDRKLSDSELESMAEALGEHFLKVKPLQGLGNSVVLMGRDSKVVGRVLVHMQQYFESKNASVTVVNSNLPNVEGYRIDLDNIQESYFKSSIL